MRACAQMCTHVCVHTYKVHTSARVLAHTQSVWYSYVDPASGIRKVYTHCSEPGKCNSCQCNPWCTTSKMKLLIKHGNALTYSRYDYLCVVCAPMCLSETFFSLHTYMVTSPKQTQIYPSYDARAAMLSNIEA